MKSNRERYRKFSASPDDEIADETCTTRLFAHDLGEVKSMCVDGKTKSDVIRELVRKALYARRYRQASTDPAFKEILRSFDDQVGVRLHHLEERLASRMEADYLSLREVIGYLYLASWFKLEQLKQVRFALSDEDETWEQFVETWDEKFRLMREAAEKNMGANAERRAKRLVQAGGGDEEP